MPWQIGYQLILKCHIVTVVPIKIQVPYIWVCMVIYTVCPLPSSLNALWTPKGKTSEHAQKQPHPRTSCVPFLPEFQCTPSSLDFIQKQWFCALAFVLATPLCLHRSKVSLKFFSHLKKEHLNMRWRTPGSRSPFQSVVPMPLCC